MPKCLRLEDYPETEHGLLRFLFDARLLLPPTQRPRDAVKRRADRRLNCSKPVPLFQFVRILRKYARKSQRQHRTGLLPWRVVVRERRSWRGTAPYLCVLAKGARDHAVPRWPILLEEFFERGVVSAHHVVALRKAFRLWRDNNCPDEEFYQDSNNVSAGDY